MSLYFLGLDSFDAHKMYVNNLEDCLVCLEYHITAPLVRKHGHLYLEWGPSILYSMAELDKRHRHFFHPKPDRLFAVLKRAEDPHAVPETLA